MKKLIALFCGLVSATYLFAYDAEIDGLYYNLNNTDYTAEVTFKNTGDFGKNDIVTADIPSSVIYNGETYKVTSIGYLAFEYCRNLKSVTIPDGVVSIGSVAFSICQSLESITIPNSVTTIESGAFQGCKALTSITIPEGVTNIGGSAFSSVENLTSIVIPNSVSRIGFHAFSHCTGLSSVTSLSVLPPKADASFYAVNVSSIHLYVPLQSVELYKSADVWKDFDVQGTVILPEQEFTASGICGADGDNLSWNLSDEGVLTISGVGEMFDYHRNKIKKPWNDNRQNIKSVIIEEGVTNISDFAFEACINMTAIEISSTVTCIGVGAFHDCCALTSIAIPNEVKRIKGYTFSGCDNLSFVQIPNTVVSIGDYAFYRCSNLKDIEIPHGVTNIGFWAFAKSGLNSIIIPNRVINIGCGAFNNSFTSVTSLSNTPPQISDYAFKVYSYNQSYYKDLYVPKQSVTEYQRANVWKYFTIKGLDISYFTVIFLSDNGTTEIDYQTIEDGLFAEAPIVKNREGYTFQGWTTDGSDLLTSEQVNAAEVTENIKYYAVYTFNVENYDGIGVFSVGEKQKVTFSPGNLQYNAALGSHQCADGTTQQGTWRFAKNQWDVVGMGYGQTGSNYCYIGGTVPNSDNSQISSDYDGWTDLFGFGTSGWNSGANAYQPYSTSKEESDYYPGGKYLNGLTGEYAYADWGVYNQIGNDTPGTWRTLTKDEWDYLVNTRSDASDKYGAAQVNGMTGVVFLPDEWTLPDNCGFTPGMPKTTNWSNWKNIAETNIYSDSQWQAMEANGAVFMPCSGDRSGTDLSRIGASGYYWTTTIDTEKAAYSLRFLSYIANCHEEPRYYGRAVRLVAEINDVPEYFTVTFVADGEVIGEPQRVEYGQSATEPDESEIPEIEGYRFKGWDTDFSNVQSDLIVKAEYEIKTYRVLFRINTEDYIYGTVEHGTVITDDEAMQIWKEYYEPKFEGTCETEKFYGWSEDFPMTITSHTVIYGYVGPDYYLVGIYSENGEKGTVALSSDAEPDQFTGYPCGTTMKLEAIANELYEFDYWTDGHDKYYTKALEVVIRQDTTFVAHFKPITFNTQIYYGGEPVYTLPEVGVTECDDNGNYTLSLSIDEIISALKETEYWNDCIDLNSIKWTTTARREKTDETRHNAQVYLTAEMIYYSVSIESADGQMGSVSQSGYGVYPCDAEAIITAIANDGCQFTQWSDGSIENPRTIAYNPETGTELSFTAMFEPVTFTVVFIGFNNETLDEQTIQKGQSATAPEAPEIEGYKFQGWKPDDFSNVQSDMTIYADYAELVIVNIVIDKEDRVIDNQNNIIEGDIINIEINAGAALVAEGGAVQDANVITQHIDLPSAASIIADDDHLHANTLRVTVNTEKGIWYFLHFPFDIPFSQITSPGEYVVLEYDGAIRAQNGKGGWVTIRDKQIAGKKGYAFQADRAGEFVFDIPMPTFPTGKVETPLYVYESAADYDANWTLTGNPFPSYFDIHTLAEAGFNAPVYARSKEYDDYDVYMPVEDEYYFHPYESFFVQKPEDIATIQWLLDGRTTELEIASQHQNAPRRAEAVRMRQVEDNRYFVELTVSDGDNSGKTRIVFNDEAKTDYELGRDAVKMEGSAPIRLYTLDEQTKYAINEQPATEQPISLGYKVAKEGDYILSATRLDAEIEIFDNLLNKVADISDGGYSFHTEAGENNIRFVIRYKQEIVSGIEDVKSEGNISVYTVTGQLLYENIEPRAITLPSGIYIIKSAGEVKKIVIK